MSGNGFHRQFKDFGVLNENRVKVDLVISDKTMPKLTGTDLARSFYPEGAQVKIIIDTGYDEDLEKVDLNTPSVSRKSSLNGYLPAFRRESA